MEIKMPVMSPQLFSFCMNGKEESVHLKLTGAGKRSKVGVANAVACRQNEWDQQSLEYVLVNISETGDWVQKEK